MQVNARNILTVYLAITVSISFLAAPIYGALTTSRLAFAMAAFAALFGYAGRGRTSEGALLMIPPTGLLLFFTHSTAFFIIGGDFWWPLSFFLMAIFSALILFATLPVHRFDIFFIAITLFGVVFVLLLIMQARAAGVEVGVNYRTRAFFSDYGGVGLTRFANSVSLFGIIAISMALFLPLRMRFLAMLLHGFFVALYLVCLFFAFAVGSRQSILALLMTLPIAGLVSLVRSRHSNRSRRFWLKLFLSLSGLLIGGTYGLNLVDIDFEWFNRRFLDTITGVRGSYGDTIRLMNIERAIVAGRENFGFGLGPGVFQARFGTATENGYLSIFADSGVIGAAVALPILVLVVGRTAWLCVSKAGNVGKVAATTLLVVSVIMLNFNELLRDTLFWAVITIAYAVQSKAHRREVRVMVSANSSNMAESTIKRRFSFDTNYTSFSRKRLGKT